MQEAEDRQMVLPGTVIDPRMFEGEATESLTDQAKITRALWLKKRALKKQLEELQTSYNVEEEKLIAMMERDDVKSMKIGSASIYRKEQTYVSVNKENETACHRWLAEQGYDSLIRNTVNSRTLSGAYKEMIELDIKIPHGIFNINPKVTIGISQGRG